MTVIDNPVDCIFGKVHTDGELSELEAWLRGTAVQHKQPTMAAPGSTYEFETVECQPSFRCAYINALNWDETTLPTKEGWKEIVVDYYDRETRTWGTRRRTIRDSHPWYRWSKAAPGQFTSLWRDDETFHRLSTGQVVIVVLIPRQADKPNGECRWCVVLCDEELFPLRNGQDVLRFKRRTGLSARSGSKARTVLMASERLYRTYHESDLDSARDDAYRWFRELELLNDSHHGDMLGRGGYGRVMEVPTDPETLARLIEPPAVEEPTPLIVETWTPARLGGGDD